MQQLENCKVLYPVVQTLNMAFSYIIMQSKGRIYLFCYS